MRLGKNATSRWISEAVTVEYDYQPCKHCQQSFRVGVSVDANCDVFLKCPTCGWLHYRHFKDGVAVHCNIGNRKAEPQIVEVGAIVGFQSDAAAERPA